MGVGVDIVELERISKDLTEIPGFAEQFCSEDEISYCNTLRDPLRSMCFAARFSAKEAVIKALGGGGEKELDWREIIIKKRASGQPQVDLIGGARLRAQELGVTSLQISFAHIKAAAIAFCVAS